MTRLRGRAPRGARVVASAPHGHGHTTTMIASIRLDGSNACLAIEGATDTAVFPAYVRRVRCPARRAGDVVVMDNLAPHKNESTLALMEAAGATVRFLPAYSPDLKPIEKMGRKVKQSLRRAEARTPREPGRGHRSRPANRHPKGCQGLVCFVRLQYYLMCSNQGREVVSQSGRTRRCPFAKQPRQHVRERSRRAEG